MEVEKWASISSVGDCPDYFHNQENRRIGTYLLFTEENNEQTL